MKNHLFPWMAGLAVFGLLQLQTFAAELRGQVVDATSGKTISGAELILIPAGGGGGSVSPSTMTPSSRKP